MRGLLLIMERVSGLAALRHVRKGGKFVKRNLTFLSNYIIVAETDMLTEPETGEAR